MRTTILVGVLALAACGGQPHNHQMVIRSSTHSYVDQGDDDDNELICQDERMTGTNMSKVVCRTPAEIAEERAAAQDWEKRPRNDITNRR